MFPVVALATMMFGRSVLAAAGSVDLIRAEFPSETQSLIFSFLSAHQTYLAMIQDRSFKVFLEEIRHHAALDSTDSAIDFFWRFNRIEISACLVPENVEAFWATPSNGRVREKRVAALSGFRNVAGNFLNLRQLLMSGMSERGALRLGRSQFRRGYAGVGLLANCDALREVNICNTRFRELSPLGKLARLEVLYLGNTLVEDLRPLEGLAALKILCLTRTPVQDLWPLAGLTRLEKLAVDRTCVDDIRPLSDLKRLRILYLSETFVGDLRPLSRLVNLTCLTLSGVPASDLSPLADLPKLAELRLDAAGFRSLMPVRDSLRWGFRLYLD